MKIFDAHLHIIDPRFPLPGNAGYVPDWYTSRDYLANMRSVTDELLGGAVVAGSFQGFDQGWLRASLRELGSGFVGVAQLRPNTDDRELRELHKAGVRAVRLNLRRQSCEDLNGLFSLAARVYDKHGWHAEFYVDETSLKRERERILQLPKVVIDHLGLSASNQETLLYMVARGAKVKATGFGRLDFDPGPLIQRIVEIDPTALLFGSDLPSTRAPRPFQASDIELVRAVTSRDVAERVFFRNAAELYLER